MPSTTAAITRRRNRAIMRSSVPLGRSAAGHQPRPVGARLVSQTVMPENRLFIAGRQLAVGDDRGALSYLLLVEADLEVSRAHGCLVQGDEHKPVTRRHANPDRRERWKVADSIDVDGFQLPDLVSAWVDHLV